MPVVEQKIEYKVVYEANPAYDGEFQMPIAPGLQGTFRLKADAIKAAKKCKDWFNQEKSLIKKAGPDGKVIETEKIDLHDNVVIMIETWIEGEKTEEDAWEGEEKPSKRKKEAAAA